MKSVWMEMNDKIPLYMKDIMKKYHLKCVKMGDLSTALVGKNFAIILSIDRFSVNASYMKKIQSDYIIFLCNNYWAERFDSDDRIDLINKDDIESVLINNLIVIANGLMSKWGYVLEGDDNWINEYKKSEWYSIRKANEIEYKKIKELSI